MLNESDIVLEIGEFWVLGKGANGFEIYRTGVTHSKRCAIVGYTGQQGIDKCRDMIWQYIAKRQGVRMQTHTELNGDRSIRFSLIMDGDGWHTYTTKLPADDPREWGAFCSESLEKAVEAFKGKQSC